MVSKPLFLVGYEELRVGQKRVSRLMILRRLIWISVLCCGITFSYSSMASGLSIRDMELVHMSIPYAKLSAGIYDDKSKDGERCIDIEEWQCIDHTARTSG